MKAQEHCCGIVVEQLGQKQRFGTLRNKAVQRHKLRDKRVCLVCHDKRKLARGAACLQQHDQRKAFQAANKLLQLDALLGGER